MNLKGNTVEDNVLNVHEQKISIEHMSARVNTWGKKLVTLFLQNWKKIHYIFIDNEKVLSMFQMFLLDM